MSYAIQPEKPKGYTNRERNAHVSAGIFFKDKMNKGSQDNARYNHMMAALADAEQDPKVAKYHYQTTIVNQPRNVLARSDYALHLSQQGKPGFIQAQDEFRKALILDEDNSILRKNYGAMLGRRGAYREAEQQSTRALQVNKHDPMIHRNLAKIQNQLGDVHSALHNNMKSIQMEARMPEELRNTKAYRQAAVQIISTGGDRNEAYKLMDSARALEKRKFVLPTTEGTNKVLLMMFERRGNALGELEQEEAKAKQEEIAREEALKNFDITKVLNKVKAAEEAKAKMLREG
jgi:tetratricopeptide (TPR) repeat protein